MKTPLIIFLFAYSLCLKEDKLSGWQKRNVTQKDDDLDNAYAAAFSNYSKIVNNIDLKIDDILRLTAYTQLVNGMNFIITFIDRKSEVPAIKQYRLYRPIPKDGKPEFEINEVHTYEETTGLIKFDDPSFTEIEYQLYKFLKISNIKLFYISYVYPIENDETKFYIINADTEDGQNLFVIGLDKASKKYDLCLKIK